MSSQLTDTLCTRCGLCCDGILFADVELAGPAEASRLEWLGIEVEDDGADRAVLEQPCAALDGTRCSIYPHRPACCRTFECRLLDDVRAGAVDVDHALTIIATTLEQVRAVRTMLGPMRSGRGLPLSERVDEALAIVGGPDATGKRAGALKAAMSALKQSVRKHFTG
jgi:hypothetical protein